MRTWLTRRRATLIRVVLVEVLPPVCFYQIVPFQHALNHKVVLLESFIKETFLYDGQLTFQDAKETRVNSSHAYLLSYLQVLVEEDLLPNRPAYVHSAQCNLIRIRYDAVTVHRGVNSWPVARQYESQFAEEDEVNEVVLASISVEDLVFIQVDDWTLLQYALQRVQVQFRENRVLGVQDDMRHVYGGLAFTCSLELLTQLEEAVLDLILYKGVQFFLSTNQLGLLAGVRLRCVLTDFWLRGIHKKCVTLPFAGAVYAVSRAWWLLGIDATATAKTMLLVKGSSCVTGVAYFGAERLKVLSFIYSGHLIEGRQFIDWT